MGVELSALKPFLVARSRWRVTVALCVRVSVRMGATRLLSLWILAPGVWSQVPALSIEPAPAPSVLSQLVRRLSLQPAQVRTEFAQLALNEMFLSYLTESVAAQEEALASAEGNLWRWIAAVDQYAMRLQALAKSPGADVLMLSHPGRTGEVLLSINGDLVMVTSARWSQQADFEQHIVEQFCRRRRCGGMHVGAQRPQYPRGQAALIPVWQLSAQGPSCRFAGGLALRFADMSGMQGKRQVCKQLMSELDTLASELAHQRLQGVRIDWDQLRILPAMGSRGHGVYLNRSGAKTWLDLPGLARARGLFPAVTPWLAARASGVEFELVIVDADAVIAPLIQK
jgi:hypothetical protein